MNESSCCSSSLPAFGVVNVLELCPHLADEGTEVQRGKGFAQEVTVTLPLHLLPTHITLTVRRLMCLLWLRSHFPGGGVCALPCRPGEGSHLQGQATLVSHLSKQSCRAGPGTKGQICRISCFSFPVWMAGWFGRRSWAGVGIEFES